MSARPSLIEFIRLIGWKPSPWQVKLLEALEEKYRKERS